MNTSQLICKETNSAVPYQILVGLDNARTLTLDQQWSLEKAVIIKLLIANHKDEISNNAALQKRLTEYSLNDFHWNWTNKALKTSNDEYQWFYLEAESKIQGVCIIFHPKNSRIDNNNIFYIDYIAAAYWNRNRPNYQKRFSNVGKLLISEAIKYSTQILELRPGFSLHSLPSAESYYKAIGMNEYELDSNYQNLRYFEACEACALTFVQSTHD